MSQLKFSLLGSPLATVGETPVSVESRKALALLFYLAVTGDRQSRDRLATLFWPEQDQSRARSGLRQALWLLKKAGVDPWLKAEQDALQLLGNYWCDVQIFRAQLEAGKLDEALDLYRDDFLAGFTLRDCPEFDQWQFMQADELRYLLANTLEAEVVQRIDQRDYDRGLPYARRWLSLDPMHEGAHRSLMQLYAHAGQHAAALRQYEECVRILDEELGVAPEDETIALYQAIKLRKFPSPASASQATPRRTVDLNAGALPSPVAPPPPSSHDHNLPIQLTAFIGREGEVAELVKLLTNADVRLVTICGFGGIGKTRLALEVTRHFVENRGAESGFPQGIFFVPLSAVSATSGMVSAIANAVGFTFYSNTPPKQQLLEYLRDKEMLLLLDNLEHLRDSAEIIGDLLLAAPGVKVLATSREPLHLQGEWQWPVAGLPYPTADADEETLLSYAAVRLFVQRARQVQAAFSLAANRKEVARICQLVSGMPLGIELAAAWLKMVPCPQIAREIERSIQFLTTRARDVPERQRSVQAVFEHAWQLLPHREQDMFKQLALFPGGVDLGAAEAVAGASLLALAVFAEKSLLYVMEDGRYQMQELLRQFVVEKLAEDPDRERELRLRHSTYFLDLLEVHAQHLAGKAQQQALSTINQEIDNIRAAWHWAVDQLQVEMVDRVLDCLYNFFQIRSHYQEGAELFESLVVRLRRADLSMHPQSSALLARALGRCGAFYQSLSDYEAAERYLQEGLCLAQTIDDRQEIAFCLNILGQIAVWRGQKEAGRAHLNESLTLCRAIGDKSGVVSALQQLANLLYATFGNYDESKILAEECLSISRELGLSNQIAYALDTLGFVTFARGEYGASRAYYQEALSLFKEIGDQHGQALTLGGLGMVNWALGGERLFNAIHDFERSLAICRKIGHQGQVSGRLGGLARILNDLGEYEQALKYGAEGLAIARTLGSPVYSSHNLYCLVETACGMNDLSAGRRYLQEGLSVALQADLLSNVAIYLYYYALILAKESKLVSTSADVQQQKQVKALAALDLVQQHPACWQLFKDRAAWLRNWIASDLSEDAIAASTAYPHNRTLADVAAEILREDA